MRHDEFCTYLHYSICKALDIEFDLRHPDVLPVKKAESKLNSTSNTSIFID